MKNSVADRGNAQSSCAGQFIGNNLEVNFQLTTVLSDVVIVTLPLLLDVPLARWAMDARRYGGTSDSW